LADTGSSDLLSSSDRGASERWPWAHHPCERRSLCSLVAGYAPARGPDAVDFARR
jgi:hypothetical protein